MRKLKVVTSKLRGENCSPSQRYRSKLRGVTLPLAKVPGSARLLSKFANEIKKGLTGRKYLWGSFIYSLGEGVVRHFSLWGYLVFGACIVVTLLGGKRTGAGHRSILAFTSD